MKPLAYAALLAAGLLAGVLTHGRAAPLFGTLTLQIFIPVLIFEAAWSLDLHLMRRNAGPITLLAVPGVLITAGIIATVTHLAGLAWHQALVLGAVLSATDPIAVVGIFRQLNVPPALATIVESESLLNDAIAVVLFRAALAGAVAMAIGGVALSIVMGAILGWLTSFALRKAVAAPFQIAATVAGAYGIYAAADAVDGSGIFAVLTFAIALHEFERHRITVQAADGVRRFWAIAAVLANALLFLLLGAAVDVTVLRESLATIGATAAAVLIARSVLAYGLLQFAPKRISRAWMHVVRMAGVRGALSVALALSLPAALEGRGALIDATFAVAAVTIVLGSLTYERRLQRLEL